MSIRAFFESFTDDCRPEGLATFSWDSKGIGFGGMYFYVDEADGYVHCENEIMSRDFLKQALCAMVDNCVLDCPGTKDEGPGRFPPDYPNRPSIIK